jgi:hypothetical protein
VQIAVVETITSFLFLLGKIIVVCCCGLCAYGWMDRAERFQPGT